MKKMSFKTIGIRMMSIVTCSLLLFTSSCEKDDPSFGSSTTKKPKFDALLSYQVDATTAGTFHNECLDQIAQNISNPQHLGDMDHFNEQKDIVENFYNDNDLDFPTYLDQGTIQGVINQIKNGTLLDDLEDASQISAEVKSELEGMFTTLDNAANSSQASNDLNTFINNIAASSYSTAEKDLMIGAANVAIKDFEFWEAAYNNTNNPWHELSISPAGTTGWAGKFNWKLFGDCAGFVAGFALGGGVLGGVAVGGMVSACITNEE